MGCICGFSERNSMNTTELDTPAVVVDLDVMEDNVRRHQAYCHQHGIAARPHIKTHKIPAIAHQQGLEIGLEVECDTGMHRAGVPSPEEAADLARRIARLPGVRFRGWMTF